jgi:hypothetical protein
MGDPFATRWPQATALKLANQAQRDVNKRVRGFKGRRGIVALPGVQLYPLPTDVLSFERVYVNGQECPSTTMSQLSGMSTRQFDQTGANFQAQWMTLPPAPYPIANCQLGPGLGLGLMYPGGRPEYWLQGGVIGFTTQVLPPASIILDDCRLVPPRLTQPTSDSPFTEDWLPAIYWKMRSYAYAADDSVGSDSQKADADKMFEQEIMELITLAGNVDEGQTGMSGSFLTHRTFYASSGAFSGGDE